MEWALATVVDRHRFDAYSDPDLDPTPEFYTLWKIGKFFDRHVIIFNTLDSRYVEIFLIK